MLTWLFKCCPPPSAWYNQSDFEITWKEDGFAMAPISKNNQKMFLTPSRSWNSASGTATKQNIRHDFGFVLKFNFDSLEHHETQLKGLHFLFCWIIEAEILLSEIANSSHYYRLTKFIVMCLPVSSSASYQCTSASGVTQLFAYICMQQYV